MEIPAARANLLVPFNLRSAAPACPFFLLSFQPFLKTIQPDVFQVGFHGPVVRPLIGHEIMEWRAGIFFAETAEIDALLCGAMPEPASLDIVVRTAAAAAVAVRGSAGAAI